MLQEKNLATILVLFVGIVAVFGILFTGAKKSISQESAGNFAGQATLTKISFADGHIHSTRYYAPLGLTGNADTFFRDLDVDKVFLFGSYPNKVNKYVTSNGQTEDDVTLAIYRKYRNKVYPFAMGFTPGEGNYLQYLNSYVKGKPFVGIGELGFGVDTLYDKGGRIDYPDVNILGQVEDLLDFAAENDLLVFIHTQRLDDTFKSNPREIDWGILDRHRNVTFISPHFVQFHSYKGFKEVVEKKLIEHCNLYAGISPVEYKEAAQHGVSKLKEAWEYLLNTYPDRFIIESDSQPNLAESMKAYSRQDVYDFLKELRVTDRNIKKIMYSNVVFLAENRRFMSCSASVNSCGDGQCTEIEKMIKLKSGSTNLNYCPTDCQKTCGNGICESLETNGEIGAGYCKEDCCGEGVCGWQETRTVKGKINSYYCSTDCR